MKKPLKYGLIAGSVIVAGIAALIIYGYNKDRMPTLPTPPGVVVPPGMRYVGGDEFDGHLDPKQWLIVAESYHMWILDHPESEALRPDEVLVHDGVMSISPGGTQRDRFVTVTHLTNISGRIAGAIEFRARLVPPAVFEGKHGARLAIGDEAGYHASFASYWLDSPDEISPKDAGEFHRYRIEWRAGVFRRYEDDRELPSEDPMMVENGFTMEESLSGLPDWIESLLPDLLVEELNSPISAFERRRHHFMANAYADALRHRHRLEIDYVRIFQE